MSCEGGVCWFNQNGQMRWSSSSLLQQRPSNVHRWLPATTHPLDHNEYLIDTLEKAGRPAFNCSLSILSESDRLTFCDFYNRLVDARDSWTITCTHVEAWFFAGGLQLRCLNLHAWTLKAESLKCHKGYVSREKSRIVIDRCCFVPTLTQDWCWEAI